MGQKVALRGGREDGKPGWNSSDSSREAGLDTSGGQFRLIPADFRGGAADSGFLELRSSKWAAVVSGI